MRAVTPAPATPSLTAITAVSPMLTVNPSMNQNTNAAQWVCALKLPIVKGRSWQEICVTTIQNASPAIVIRRKTCAWRSLQANSFS